MVMADRPDVQTASLPVAAVTLVGLGQALTNGLARVPFRRPWEGPASVLDNVGRSVTRQVVRSFMGFSMGLPIEEFRSMEKVLDKLCSVVMPPFVDLVDDVEITHDVIAGVPGLWCRRRSSTDEHVDDGEDKASIDGTILYLHGGGYIGTSPTMYSFFTARLCRESRCAVFVADYRLAPEFPYPAGVEDAARVLAELVRRGAPRERLFVAGDSGGGGLATTLVLATPSHVDLETPAGVILFSPEVDLRLDQPSVTDNAPLDILPWNIPTAAYLHGTDPSDGYVSATVADVADFPPTFVAWGDDEMFRDPIREFVARLEGAGVPTDAHEAPGMFHVFPILMPWADASRRVYAAVAAFVAERLAAAPPLHQRTVDGIGS